MRGTSTAVLLMSSAMLVASIWSTVRVSGLQTQRALPGPLGEYVAQHVNLTPEENNRLLRGEPVTKLLPGDASKEVAVFGAIWMDAPVSAYVAAVKDIEQ